MADAITISGMRELMMMKIQGKEMPERWKEQADRYIYFKRIEYERHKNCCPLCKVRQQYNEAKNIRLFLGE